jgi:plastocyanin
MTRIALALAVAAAASVAIGTAFARPAATPTLRGAVGPGFTITLTQNGKQVKRLKAGTYRFVISDRSAAHNFELERTSGGAFHRELTSVGFTGTKTVTLRLGNGSWKFYCDPHATMMRGVFAVGAGTVAAAPSTTADDHGGHGANEPGDDKGGRR